MILINDGVVKVPHLLMSTAENGKQVPWVQPHEPPVGDIHSGYWEIAKRRHVRRRKPRERHCA
ncbi:penicillin-binding protein 2 [Citrobacter koseri]|uniref:Penicillin-binding protein 2 n=1 Tax=Citrobacter koseri TaxID=545 RepID=A0A2X2X4R5_CITKO|nr:penicillin-binding protein 2 [Citrobacter koseri]